MAKLYVIESPEELVGKTVDFVDVVDEWVYFIGTTDGGHAVWKMHTKDFTEYKRLKEKFEGASVDA